jgi:uncharacterized phage-associated protein
MLKAIDVANYFLSLVDEDSGDLLSNLKIQKLVYYAQGVHLALTDKPLFEESIEAWAHGPVVPDLYREFKQYGSGSIPSPEEFDLNKFSEEEKETLDEVYSVFGQFSAWKLRNMTHEEAPWKNTDLNFDISRKELKSYFQTLIQND